MADPAWLSRQIHTWHVEQVAPFNPPTQAARAYRLERLATPDPLYCRYLYAAVGFKWVWYERLAWSKADWQTCLGDANRHTFVAYIEGSPIGYFELVDHGQHEIEIAYFGLMPNQIGRGLGKPFLFDAINEAKALGAKRIWLHTCDMDHPAALSNYLACGFSVFKEESFEALVPSPMPDPFSF